MDDFAHGLTLVGAIGAGICGGVFFAFSTFIMRALDRIPDRDGLVAMQQINREAPSPVFMAVFVGTALVSVALIVLALRDVDEPWAPKLLIGSGLYLAGFVLTMAFHVPRNDALLVVDPATPAGIEAWNRYVGPWTLGNHVRTITSVGSSLAFILALTAD